MKQVSQDEDEVFGTLGNCVGVVVSKACLVIKLTHIFKSLGSVCRMVDLHVNINHLGLY